VRRRDFITLVGGATAGWPLAARAQQPMPRIGHLAFGIGGGSAEDAFRQGLRDFGYVEGQNLSVEYRRTGETSQLDSFAAELIELNLVVIVAAGSQATRALLRQTKTIPIVTLSSDPVGLGFVASLAKPGGNVTGVSLLAPEISGKRLALLKQLYPTIARVAVLWNPDDPSVRASLEETQVAAASLALSLQVSETRNAEEIDGAVLAAANAHSEAVVLLPTPLFDRAAGQIAKLATEKQLPTIYFNKESVEAGILLSYGPSLLATIRRQPYFVDRIIKGTKPADLPVEEPTKFELAINLKTAKALGLTVPQSLLATADEVIE
jgi:putative ABC transport system substrate-binding protein